MNKIQAYERIKSALFEVVSGMSEFEEAKLLARLIGSLESDLENVMTYLDEKEIEEISKIREDV